MARKYDRYGRNRQYRRNPTRSPKFFPYRLPFQNDFRLKDGNGTEVSAATSSRWRQVVAEITQNARNAEIADEYNRSLHAIRKMQKRGIEIASFGIGPGESMAAFDETLAAGIRRGFARHRRNNELGFYNYWV